MIDKNLIIINKIEPIYVTKMFIGENPTLTQVGLRIEFTYKKMDAHMELKTDGIYDEEIKDLIIEQLR